MTYQGRQDFLSMLPHRDPFLFLDEVEIDAADGVVNAHWSPQADWPIFAGHFPDSPLVPGVILVEVMAQAACILGRTMAPETAGKPVYLVGVDHARFRRQVVPGDRVDVVVRFQKRRRDLWSFHGRTTVEGMSAADADLLAAVPGAPGGGGGGDGRSRTGHIHPTAIVHPDAELHPSASVGPYAIVEAGVRIGAETSIGAHAHVQGNTILGERNRVHSFAVIGSPPQDKKYGGENTRLVIGHENVLREFVTINPGTESGGGETVIGDRNLLMAYVHVAHDCRIGNDCVVSNNAQLAGHVELEDGVVVGGMTGVHQFVRVGRGAMAGGGSMLSLDLPPYCIAVGNRAMLHGLNLVGLKRAEVPSETVSALKEAYRILFRQGKLIKDAAEDAEAAVGDDEAVQRMLAFIRASERGIVRPERSERPEKDR